MNTQNQNEKSRRGLKVRHPGGSWRSGKERRAWEQRGAARSFRGTWARRKCAIFVEIGTDYTTRKTGKLRDGGNAFCRHAFPLRNRSTRKPKASREVSHGLNLFLDGFHTGLHPRPSNVDLGFLYSLTAHESNVDCRGMRSLRCV